jgi:membrane protease YdiL (CAAX protease family)
MEGLLERYKSIITAEQLQQMQNLPSVFRSHPILVGLLLGLIAGITINAVAGFGEELGWRGFMQKELGFLGFWKSSVVIGIIWGIWHAPIILMGHNYPHHPVAGAFMMVVLCVLLAPIFGYVRFKAKSVIASAIIHGSFNGTYGLAIVVAKGGSDLTLGVTGLAGFVVLAVVDIGIFIYERFLAIEPLIVG